MANFPLPKGYQRLDAFPLDETEIYETLALATTYATSPSAYAGQVISVVDDTGNTSKAYIIYPDLTLSEIGSGGGSSITASNGLTLTGSDVALGGTLTQDTTISGPFQFEINTTGIDGIYLTDNSGDGVWTEVTNGGHSDTFVEGGGDISRYILDEGSIDEYVELGDYIVTVAAGDFVMFVDGGNAFYQLGGDNVAFGLTMNGANTQFGATAQTTSFVGRSSLTFETATKGITFDETTGLKFDADYSALYTDRSLVDKEYVDGVSPLKVGAGTDSIVQITTSDTSTAVSEGSVTFGKNNITGGTGDYVLTPTYFAGYYGSYTVITIEDPGSYTQIQCLSGTTVLGYANITSVIPEAAGPGSYGLVIDDDTGITTLDGIKYVISEPEDQAYGFTFGENNNNIGKYSLVGGIDVTNNGIISNVFGDTITNDGNYSTVLGNNITNSNDNSTILGNTQSNTGSNSVLIGSNSDNSNDNNFLIGDAITATGTELIGIGNTMTLSGNNSIGIGNGIITDSSYSVAIGGGGFDTSATGYSSFAVGGSTASGSTSVAINRATATNERSIAIGYLNAVHGEDSTSIGGQHNTINVANVFTTIIGCDTLTATQDHMVYVPALMLSTGTTPAAPEEGTIYFNSTDKHFYGYDGTAWKQLDN